MSYNCNNKQILTQILKHLFLIYPNPASSILNIEVKEQTQITIVNGLGDIVKTESINGTSKINVSNLNNGIYFIQDSKYGKAIKFIKTNFLVKKKKHLQKKFCMSAFVFNYRLCEFSQILYLSICL